MLVYLKSLVNNFEIRISCNQIMSSINSSDNKFESIAAAARSVLDAYGGYETSGSSRAMYTQGDLNISSEDGLLEIIFRGTLVFRYAPGADAGSRVFEEHGVWREEVERMARTLHEPPSADNAA